MNNIKRSTFELCLCVLISALFLIIFLLFTSLDTSSTWNVNRPTTKTSTSSEFSTGHAFHFFKLIFSLVTSFVLPGEEKISKKIKRKIKESQKYNDNPKIVKKDGQKWNNI